MYDEFFYRLAWLVIGLTIGYGVGLATSAMKAVRALRVEFDKMQESQSGRGDTPPTR